METIRIDIVNPKAKKIIKELAELKLINIRDKNPTKSFAVLLKKLRSKDGDFSWTKSQKRLNPFGQKDMADKAERVIFDTNIWISFLITKDLKKLDGKIKSGKVKLLFSTELIEEFLTVANRAKFKKYFDEVDLEILLDLFDVYGELVDIRSNVKVCRDPKDNFLLSLAKDSKANFLVTGDKDLLTIKKFEQTKIIEFSEFIKKIK